MLFNLTEDLCYFVDKGIYEQKMAIENMVFMLSKYSEDNNDNFLSSNIFEKLHNKTIEKTASRWYRENEIIQNFINIPLKKYTFDLAHQMLFVETR
jgi:hypothetical protein